MRWAAAAPTMYALVSVNEYVTHRYYQHGEFNSSETLKTLYCKLTGAEEAPTVRVRVRGVRAWEDACRA